MEFAVFIFLSLITGLKAENLDNKNQTIQCSLGLIGPCFNKISGLGGNFSARYDQKSTEVNKTCSARGEFETCLTGIQEFCSITNYKLLPTNSILHFVRSLCKNDSLEQRNFLNSSVCYNQNQGKRIACVKRHSTSETDAKSLCCQAIHTQKCLEKDMTHVCLKNATDFQNNLIDTYSSYANLLCKPYEKICGAASVNTLSFFAAVLTVIVAFANNPQ